MNNLFQSVRNLYKYLKGSDDVALEGYNERFKELLTPIIAAIVSSPAMLIFLLTCAATVLACWWQFNLNYLYIKTGDQRLSYFITGKPQYDIVTIGICVLLIILGILLVKIRAKKFWERNLVEPAKKEEDKSNPPKVEGEEGINEKKSFEVGKILKRWWEGIASLAGLKGLLYLISFSICLSFLFRCIGFIVELVIQSTNYANRSESFGDCLKCLFPILVSLVTCVGNYLFYFTSLRVKSSKNHKHCRELCAIFNLKREKPAGTFQVLTLIIIVIFAGLGFTSKQPLLLLQDKLSECGVQFMDIYITVWVCLVIFYAAWLVLLLIYRPYIPSNVDCNTDSKKSRDSKKPADWFCKNFVILAGSILIIVVYVEFIIYFWAHGWFTS